MRRWPRRPRLVAGNWKMNKTPAEGAALARELRSLLAAQRRCEVALCPAFPALGVVGEALRDSGLHLGAQNLHPEAKGAFTGEVSGPMLAGAGCAFVIVGHSERRQLFGETDAMVARKLRAAHQHGLTPIVCVGETLAEREAGRTAEVLVRQVRAAYEGLDAGASAATVIAYEPVWAIGTGKVATLEQAREAHAMIRSTLDQAIAPELGREIAILYGGSVNAENAPILLADPEIDGALVGGAALEAAAFVRIVMAAGS